MDIVVDVLGEPEVLAGTQTVYRGQQNAVVAVSPHWWCYTGSKESKVAWTEQSVKSRLDNYNLDSDKFGWRRSRDGRRERERTDGFQENGKRKRQTVFTAVPPNSEVRGNDFIWFTKRYYDHSRARLWACQLSKNVRYFVPFMGLLLYCSAFFFLFLFWKRNRSYFDRN